MNSIFFLIIYRNMINTYNESSLHKSLKTLYTVNLQEYETEAEYENFIVDIKTKEGNVIEIQTTSLSHLIPKIKYFISIKKKITIVFPIVSTKYIQTTKTDKTVTRKKSPKHASIYTSFRELTALAPYLLNRYVFLEILDVTVTEERLSTDVPVQSKNQRRRFKKNWIKTNKILNEIISSQTLHGKKSYISLLPEKLPNEFTSTQFCNICKDKNIKITANDVRLILWVYTKMGLLTREKKEHKKSYTYKFA